MASTRACGSVTARGTNSAPIHRVASAATTKSTELGRWSATRSSASDPEGFEATGHPADLVDQLAVGELPVEVLDGRMAGPPFRLLDHHGQKVGAHGVVLPVGDGWLPRTSWPGSSPVGSPPSKVTAPRFTVQR